MNSKVTPLPDNLRLEDIFNGEIEVHDIVLQFFKYLIGGPDHRWGNYRRYVFPSFTC